jgi:hypothetical protein
MGRPQRRSIRNRGLSRQPVVTVGIDGFTPLSFGIANYSSSYLPSTAHLLVAANFVRRDAPPVLLLLHVQPDARQPAAYPRHR